ncbi:MAG TPA: tetratricopeptide repeat protein [Geobacteraceae bacterium]
MPENETERLVSEAGEAFKRGDTKTALERYEKLIAIERTPEVCSALAYCLAREKAAFREAITLCNEAIKKDPKSPRHFLLLGRIYLLLDRKKEAIRAFNLGLRHGGAAEIGAELRQLGYRKQPVVPFLRREHPLNKYLGKMLSRMGLR